MWFNLLKYICVKELESELKQSDISIKIIDSFHTLTSKLRIHISEILHAEVIIANLTSDTFIFELKLNFNNILIPLTS